MSNSDRFHSTNVWTSHGALALLIQGEGSKAISRSTPLAPCHPLLLHQFDLYSLHLTSVQLISNLKGQEQPHQPALRSTWISTT